MIVDFINRQSNKEYTTRLLNLYNILTSKLSFINTPSSSLYNSPNSCLLVEAVSNLVLLNRYSLNLLISFKVK